MSSSSRPSNSNSNSNNTSHLKIATRSVLVASRPNSDEPSKQKIDEIKEYQGKLDVLFDKEEKFKAEEKSLSLETKLITLHELLALAGQGAGESFMMSRLLGFPLNKTFFNVFCEFQKKWNSFWVQICNVHDYKLDLETRKLKKNGYPLLSAIQNEIRLLAEKVKMLNEFPTTKEKLNELIKKCDEAEKVFHSLYHKAYVEAPAKFKLVQQSLEQWIKQIEYLEKTFDLTKEEKIKLATSNLAYAEEFAKPSARRKRTIISSTAQVQQSLPTTIASETSKKPKLEQIPEESSPATSSNGQNNPSVSLPTKFTLSVNYIEPSQDLYNTTQTQSQPLDSQPSPR